MSADPDLVQRVIDCAIEVHRNTGPGLGDDVYETCLAIELTDAGIPFERGRRLRLVYDGHSLNLEFEVDFVVDGSLVVEVEAVDQIEDDHECALRTVVRFGPFQNGLLLNFNTVVFADEGILRMSASSDDDGRDNGPPEGVDAFEDPEQWAGRIE